MRKRQQTDPRPIFINVRQASLPMLSSLARELEVRP